MSADAPRGRPRPPPPAPRYRVAIAAVGIDGATYRQGQTVPDGQMAPITLATLIQTGAVEEATDDHHRT